MAILGPKAFGDIARSILDRAFAEQEPDDGLRSFAVWTERNYERDEIVVAKIEEYDPTVNYPPTMSGVVWAKDELDAWSFVDRLNRDREYYERHNR